MPNSAFVGVVPQPVRVNTPERNLGEPGDAILLLNAGDDPLYWSLGPTAPAAGEPGFVINPAGRHQITLPAASLPLWAWSPGRTRLATAPVAARGVAPTATVRMTVDATPRQLAEPPGWALGSNAILRVVGAGAVSYLFAESQPAGDVSLPALVSGTDFPLAHDGGDQDMWVWTRRFAGSAVLYQLADPLWEL